MSPGGVVISVGALLLVVVLCAVWVRRADGRVTLLSEAVPDGHVTPDGGLHFVLLTTPYCSRCPAMSRVLDELAASDTRISASTRDLTEHPDLARSLNVLTTPTTLVLDSSDRLRARISGVRDAAQLRAELSTLIPGDPS